MPLRAETQPPAQEMEARIKVAYIYNLLKFVEWPGYETGDGVDAPITICTLGSGPVVEKLRELSGRKVSERRIEVVNVRERDKMPFCHLLFICSSSEDELVPVLRQLSGSPVLNVSDSARYANRGGMIGFFREGDRIRLEINLPEVRRAGLNVSAKLLEVAKVVQ